MRFNPMILLLLPLFIWGCSPEKDPKIPEPNKVVPKPYNLVLISIDTLRPDRVNHKTAPNISKFAEKCLNFTSAKAQSSWTTPSHASLFTSLYPSVLNMGHWPNPGRINPKAFTLAEALKKGGYETAAFLEAGMVSSKFGFSQGYKPYRQGFKHIHESVPECLKWIKANQDKKFHVFLHTYDVHRYDPPEGFNNRFSSQYKGPVEKGIPLARSLQQYKNQDFLSTLDQADRERIKAIYDEALLYVDHWMGEFFNGLEEMGLKKSTVVVLTSDHGEEFWDHGHTGHGYTNFQEMLNVPLMVYHPDATPGETDQIVGLIDCAPTFTEMLGLPTPKFWQGESFFKLLQGEKIKQAWFTFAEKGHMEQKSIQNKEWKLIREYKTRRDVCPEYTDKLYHLKTDPRETTDLSKKSPKVFSTLQKLLEQWIKNNNQRKGKYQILDVEMDAKLKEQIHNLGYTGK